MTYADMTKREQPVFLRPWHLSFYKDAGFRGYADPALGLKLKYDSNKIDVQCCKQAFNQSSVLAFSINNLACSATAPTKDHLMMISELMVANGFLGIDHSFSVFLCFPARRAI